MARVPPEVCEVNHPTFGGYLGLGCALEGASTALYGAVSIFGLFGPLEWGKIRGIGKIGEIGRPVDFRPGRFLFLGRGQCAVSFRIGTHPVSWANRDASQVRRPRPSCPKEETRA